MTGVVLVAGLLAFFDLIWQRFDHLKKMRMSPPYYDAILCQTLAI